MEKSNLLLIPIFLILFSCSTNSEKRIKEEGLQLSPETKIVEGFFSETFQVIMKRYKYKIIPAKDNSGLPSFEMPISFVKKSGFDYKSAKISDSYHLEFNFMDSSGEIIFPVSIATDFEVVKYYEVKGINFKELLTAERNAELTYNLKSYLDKNAVEKIVTAKYFKLDIVENTPISILKSISKSFPRSNEISKIDLKNGNIALIKYNAQSHDTYWDSGKKIEKTMVGLPARVIMKLDFIEKVEVVLPFDDKVYITKISKSDIETYTKSSFSQIRRNWNENFSDKYIYKINNPERSAYFSKFVKIE